MGPSVEGVLTICFNGSALLNKMVAMPIYDENTKNLLQNQETLVYSIRDSRSTKLVQMMILG